MRFLLHVLLCLALLISVCISLSADSNVVVVVDPNSNGAITAKAYAKTDPSLVQKVTYEARHQPVKQILDDLREMTGVKLVAGSRDSDWPVRSRKMNIFVKDIPLCDLMDSICRVMKFRWSRYDKVEPMIYRLKVHRKAADLEDAMVQEAETKKEEAWQSRRQEWIDIIMKYGDKPRSDLEYLRESDPETYEMVQLGALQSIYALFKEVPETKGRYAQGRSFRISADNLSPSTKGLLFDAANEFCKHLQRGGFLGPRTKEPQGWGNMLKPDDKFDMVYIRLDDANSFTPGRRWGNMGKGTGYFNIMKGSQDFEINEFRYRDPILGPASSMSNILINEGVDPEEAWAEHRNKAAEPFWKKKLEEEEALYPSEPLIEHAAFPEMEKTVKPKVDQSELEKDPGMIIANYAALVQKSMSDSSGLGVVSDSWANPEIKNGKGMPDGDMKLGEMLDKFCTGLNYNWDKQGHVLEFRHRKAWRMRLSQIPDEWVSAWSKNTKKNGFLSLDDLAGISTLTFEQAEESLRPDQVLGYRGIYRSMLDVLDYNGSVVWLRLYSSLKPQQKKILAREQGLNGHMLTSEQWKLAQPMFDRIGMRRGDVMMRSGVTVGDDQKKVEVWFEEIDIDSWRTDRTWRIGLPTYTPPKPVEKEGDKK